MKQPGRNEKCPCGSGHKYKKCHGAPPTEEQKARWQRVAEKFKIGG